MKYPVRIFTDIDGFPNIEVPNEILNIQIFLLADIQSDAGYFMELIDKVLNGESEYEELTGNVCTIEIRRDYTKVIDNFWEVEGNECKIETIELKKIINYWLDEVKKIKGE